MNERKLSFDDHGIVKHSQLINTPCPENSSDEYPDQNPNKHNLFNLLKNCTII